MESARVVVGLKKKLKLRSQCTILYSSHNNTDTGKESPVDFPAVPEVLIFPVLAAACVLRIEMCALSLPWVLNDGGQLIDSEIRQVAIIRSRYNPKFLKYIELFVKVGADSRIFPKKCATCGQVYRNFPEYIHRTEAVSEGLADYSGVLDLPRTMQYRNCSCGSTLTILFTKDVYPMLDKFWEMLGMEARETNRPQVEVVKEFRQQCNRYIHEMEIE